MFTFFVILSIIAEINCEHSQGQQIFFPREATQHHPPCVAYDGQHGSCRLLVKCATFFAEIAELSRSPCKVSEFQQGVCCPRTKQQTRDPVTVANSKIEPNREITFLPLTTDDLNTACRHSLQTASMKDNFANNLVNQNIIAQQGTASFMHSRLFEVSDEVFQKGQNASIILDASNDLAKSLNLNKIQIEDGLSAFSAMGTIINDVCPISPPCPDARYSYRTMDGSCNNLIHKDWGKTTTAFTRLLMPDYQDGVSAPRASVENLNLPSARAVSSVISPSASDVYTQLTNMIWQWGQFIDHDITHTPISKGARKTDISCCTRDGKLRSPSTLHPECFPINISHNDHFYQTYRQTCMNFVRSMAAIREDCKFGPREQLNQLTSYLDASNVYGSTEKAARVLRSNQNGELKITRHGDRELLPADMNSHCSVGRRAEDQCFLAGDSRVNEQPDLVVMHIVWLRQHNKIAKELHKLNPRWTDEILYQEARRIVGAQMQHITYNEYLPIVLGRDYMESFGILPLETGYFRGYKDNVDATISNSFATAAFRYGHTLITDSLEGFSKFGRVKTSDEISKTQFVPFSLYQPETLDNLIRGLSLQKSQKFDRFFSEQLTNKLFAGNRPFGMDLVALNIQRGRDHGIPAYTKWRKACGLNPIESWDDLYREQNIDPQIIQRLQEIYASVHDIDLFIGGVSEKPVRETLLGSTFLCIIGRQFIRLKLGDRFYYENGLPKLRNAPGDTGELVSSFTEAQLDEIRKTSLSRILCDNSDNIQLMQPLAFVTAHSANSRATCLSDILIPRMSLEPWKNEIKWV